MGGGVLDWLVSVQSQPASLVGVLLSLLGLRDLVDLHCVAALIWRNHADFLKPRINSVNLGEVVRPTLLVLSFLS